MSVDNYHSNLYEEDMSIDEATPSDWDKVQRDYDREYAPDKMVEDNQKTGQYDTLGEPMDKDKLTEGQYIITGSYEDIFGHQVTWNMNRQEEEVKRKLKELGWTPPGESKSASSSQIGGSHYKKYPIQPYKFCLVNGLNNLQSEVISYVVRYKDKGGKRDLEKAIHTIELLIEEEYG